MVKLGKHMDFISNDVSFDFPHHHLDSAVSYAFNAPTILICHCVVLSRRTCPATEP